MVCEHTKWQMLECARELQQADPRTLYSEPRALKEFTPALSFLGKFLVMYLVGNLLYGLMIESYGSRPDPVTGIVTRQTSAFLNAVGLDTSTGIHPAEPNVVIYEGRRAVLSVFEGCNGINVMIVFVAFLFAFGGSWRRLALFVPAGIVIIHLANILRISLLFLLAKEESEQFYYYHKYFFTATLYLFVFALWFIWVTRLHGEGHSKATG